MGSSAVSLPNVKMGEIVLVNDNLISEKGVDTLKIVTFAFPKKPFGRKLFHPETTIILNNNIN